MQRWFLLIKDQWVEALVFALMSAGTSSWTNRRLISDMRCHNAHVSSQYRTYLEKASSPAAVRSLASKGHVSCTMSTCLSERRMRSCFWRASIRATDELHPMMTLSAQSSTGNSQINSLALMTCGCNFKMQHSHLLSGLISWELTKFLRVNTNQHVWW